MEKNIKLNTTARIYSLPLFSKIFNLTISHLTILFICLFTLYFYSQNLFYNIPYSDEAIYIVVGKLGVFQLNWEYFQSESWIIGNPFIYPSVTALVYNTGGILGSRLLNVIFGVLLVELMFVLVHLLSDLDKNNKLFSAVITSIVFISSGITYYVTRIATYDTPATYFFVLGIYMLVFQFKNGYKTGKWYFGSFIFILLAFLIKYTFIVFIPFIFAISYFILKKENFHYWRSYFVVPLITFICLYIFFYFNALVVLFSEQVEPVKSSLTEVFIVLWENLKVILLFYIAGSIGMLLKRKWKEWFALSIFAFLIPLLHLIASRAQSLDRQLLTSIVFLSLVAGIGIGYLLNMVSGKLMRLSFTGLLVIALILSCMIMYYSENEYTTQWANSERIIKDMISEIKNNDKVLSEEGAYATLAAYEINNPKNMYTFDWMEYRGKEGVNAYGDAVKDGYFKMIILQLDESYRSEANEEIYIKIKENLNNNYKLSKVENGFELYKRIY